MRVYLFRHGKAEGHHIDDFERALTDFGVERTRTAGRVLGRLGVRPARIISSPRVRARQTAEIVAEALGMAIEIDKGVDFGFNTGVVRRVIDGMRADGEVMFVGHNPSMSQVTADMTGVNASLKKGGMARIDVGVMSNPVRGELVWLLAPAVFDALGEGEGAA